VHLSLALVAVLVAVGSVQPSSSRFRNLEESLVTGLVDVAELTFSELESERRETDRGFESRRFRLDDQHKQDPAGISPTGSFCCSSQFSSQLRGPIPG
jgi:hypothetical protein